MRQLVAAQDLQPGDKLENGATISRAWVGMNAAYVMYEAVGGGIRTTHRHKKYSVERP